MNPFQKAKQAIKKNFAGTAFGGATNHSNSSSTSTPPSPVSPFRTPSRSDSESNQRVQEAPMLTLAPATFYFEE